MKLLHLTLLVLMALGSIALADELLANTLERLAAAVLPLRDSHEESIRSVSENLLAFVRSLQTRASASSTPQYVASLDGDLVALKSGDPELVRIAYQDLEVKSKRVVTSFRNSIGAKVRLTVKVLEGGQNANDCFIRGNPATIPNETPAQYIFNNPNSPYTATVAPGLISLWVERAGNEIARRLVSVGEDGEPVQAEPVVFDLQ